ncbi:MAG: hypothetical protein DMF88_15755 [Acidobacteria bacterium]|nr:MAG: hypothetical protein DMF88_15755 [Acidobacteriota bacterium]
MPAGSRMPPGYHGCYLRIDASNGHAERMPLADDLLRQYLGGSGLGARLLLDENAATVDPLAPDAPIVFAFSPLVGTPLTTSAKFAVVSRSPLTHRINDALAGSGFAIAGKRCGCDAIMIVGRAKQLSVLVIDDQNVRLQPAADVDALDSSYRIDLARWPPCRTRRQRRGPRKQEHQSRRGSRHPPLRVGASARARRTLPRSVGALVRPGNREVP